MSEHELSRRAVLGAAATTTVAAAWTQVLAKAEAEQGDAEGIDVGLITEPTASHCSGYLDVLSNCHGVRRVSVADATGKTEADSERRLGKRFHRFFDDPRRMLAECKPALAVVTTEGHRSPEAIRAALEADCHVLTEKPGCATLAAFEQVVRQADRRKRQVMLAMATRSFAAVKRAREILAAGWLGKLYSTNMDWIADQTRLKSQAYQQSWLSFKELAGGGKLIFHGIHYLDVIQYLFDDPIQEVSCFCQNVGGQPIEVEDAAVVNFRFARGMIGSLNTGYYLPSGKQLQIRIWGSQGWLRLDFRAKVPLEWESTHPAAPRGVQSFHDQAGGYQPFFQEAIDAVRGKAEWPITSAESLRALRVVFAAYDAAESRQTRSLG